MLKIQKANKFSILSATEIKVLLKQSASIELENNYKKSYINIKKIVKRKLLDCKEHFKYQNILKIGKCYKYIFFAKKN